MDTFLNTHPRIVLLCGLILGLLATLISSRARKGFLVVYIAFILFMTLAHRGTDYSGARLKILWSYRQFLTSRMHRQIILNNIWLFFPMGAAIYDDNHRHALIWCLALTIMIEAIQYVTGLGICDFDDIISNFLGAAIGYGLAASVNDIISSRKIKLFYT